MKFLAQKVLHHYQAQPVGFV